MDHIVIHVFEMVHIIMNRLLFKLPGFEHGHTNFFLGDKALGGRHWSRCQTSTAVEKIDLRRRGRGLFAFELTEALPVKFAEVLPVKLAEVFLELRFRGIIILIQLLDLEVEVW